MDDNANAIKTVSIDHVGHRGDGVAKLDGRTVYVPFTLAGEKVRIRRSGDRAELVEIVEAAPERRKPVCMHFGACGGCSLQHMNAPAYLDWKRVQVRAALSARRIDVPVAETRATAPGTRRRTVLTAVRAGRIVHLGYHARQSHRVIEISECPVLSPAILDKLAALKSLAEIVCPGRGLLKMTVLSTTGGLDVAVGGVAKLTNATEQRLIRCGLEAGFARLSVDNEILFETNPPAISIGGTMAVPPPGGFVQASQEAEAALSAFVLEATGASRRVADLFCGTGTFTLRIAGHAAVHGVESDAAAVAALERAARHGSGLKPLSVERRDLFRRPLLRDELNGFDAVVFDPPRAGARAQAEMLAQCDVPTVVAVSCNPATFARDLRTLIDGGYRLRTVQPVDQFVFSPHIEVVAVLTRS